MYEDIHFNIRSTESTVNIEKLLQFISLARASVSKVIFPKTVWDGRMRMPSLFGKMKMSLWPVVCFLRCILDFFLQKGRTAHLFLA